MHPAGGRVASRRGGTRREIESVVDRMRRKHVEERRLDAGPVILNYAEGSDNGAPLVLLHGGSSRWQWWESIIDELAQRTHTFAPDLRGHGRSTWTPGHYRLFDFVDDIAVFLRRVVRRPAILLGHSLGGEVALITAALHPTSVLAVIDEDGPLSAEGALRAIAPTRPVLFAMRALAGSTLPEEKLIEHVAEIPVGFETGNVRRFAEVVGGDREILAWCAETYRHHDPAMLDAVIEFEEMHRGYDGDKLLPLIGCAVVILQGDPERGGALTEPEVAHAMTLLRDGRHERAWGLGHAMHIEDPERFLAIVLPIIDELTRLAG
jgi:pimeloyl-ACP methyl ester carboxylesterase